MIEGQTAHGNDRYIFLYASLDGLLIFISNRVWFAHFYLLV
jgi:hypothetical protein